MTRVREVPVEALDAAAFQPFGMPLSVGAGPPVLTIGAMRTWRVPFEVDGAMEMTICRYSRQPLEWSRMERHLNVTQAFLPLTGAETIMVVAPPTDPARRDDLPPP